MKDVFGLLEIDVPVGGVVFLFCRQYPERMGGFQVMQEQFIREHSQDCFGLEGFYNVIETNINLVNIKNLIELQGNFLGLGDSG